MDLNSFVLGEGVMLRMGHPIKTTKGRILHPLIRGARIVTGPVGVTHKGLAATVAIAALALYLGYVNHSDPARLLSKIALVIGAESVAQSPDPALSAQALASKGAQVNPASSEPAHVVAMEQAGGALLPVPASVLEAASAPAPSVDQQPASPASTPPYPVPAGAVFAPPQSVATSNVAPVSAQVQAQPGVVQRRGEQDQKSMTVFDVSKPPKEVAKTDPGQVSASVSSAPPVTDAQPTAKPSAPPDAKLPAMGAVVAAAPVSKSVDVVPQERGSAAGVMVVEAKPAPAKKADLAKKAESVKKTESGKRVADSKVQDASEDVVHQRAPARLRQSLHEDDDAGFAKPIRQRSVGGQGDQPRQANSAQGGSAPQSINEGARVEILDVSKNAVIVTNPKTNLPVMVRLGAKLPTGQTLLGVDSATGVISTTGGNFKME